MWRKNLRATGVRIRSSEEKLLPKRFDKISFVGNDFRRMKDDGNFRTRD